MTTELNYGFESSGSNHHAVEEVGDELVFRVLAELSGGADLLDVAFVEDDDAVGEFEGLVLVMRDEERGDAGLVVELAEPFAQGFAHFGVESAEGLVEQQDLRADGESTGEGDALTLAAAELGGVAVAIAFEGDAAQQFGDAAVDVFA